MALPGPPCRNSKMGFLRSAPWMVIHCSMPPMRTNPCSRMFFGAVNTPHENPSKRIPTIARASMLNTLRTTRSARSRNLEVMLVLCASRSDGAPSDGGAALDDRAHVRRGAGVTVVDVRDLDARVLGAGSGAQRRRGGRHDLGQVIRAERDRRGERVAHR